MRESDNPVMDLSLIISTRDRCHQLVRCLDYIRQIKSDRLWELIIVDNGSTDETAAVVRDFILTASVPAVCVLEPKRGKSNALNTALGSARGQILAFTDDDCYPAPDFVSRLCSIFDDPSVGYISGRVILHDLADHPLSLNDSPTPLTFRGRLFLTCGSSIVGANMAFRRSVLLDIGGFDPFFGPGSSLFAAEDLDVAGRASAMGYQGRYCPELVVRHHHGRKKSDGPRLMRAYGIGMGAYHMKLLLRGHELLWYARSLYQVRRRFKMSGRMLLWEPVGGAKYAYLYLMYSVRSWFGRTLV